MAASLFRTPGRIWSSMWPRCHLRIPLLQYSSSQDAKMTENKTYLVDTYALVKRLEAQGLPTNQAETITVNLIEITNNNLKHATSLFVSKDEFDKFMIVQDSTLRRLMFETRNMEDKIFTLMQREIEKLKEKMEIMDQKFTSRFDREIPYRKFEMIKYCAGSFVISLGIVLICM